MALSAAERAKRYRERKKANQESRETFLQKERERQRNRYVNVADRTKREQRITRRRWRKNQKTSRASKKILVNEEHVQTPPPTPDAAPERCTNDQRRSLQRKRSKAYRDIIQLKRKLANEKRKAECYRKRYIRERSRHSRMSNSPFSKTAQQLKGIGKRVPGNVRRTLLFHNVLIAHLKQKYKSTDRLRGKQTISKLVRGSILRKYRMLERTRRALSIFPKERLLVEFTRKRRSDAISEENKEAISSFFERDDNSRMMPGKRDTITRKKIKKQKRLLSDNMKILHAKFLYENPQVKLTYSSFCSLRPYWVVTPKLTDRNTCLCKRHDNIQLMVNKLHREGATETNDLSWHYKQLVCDANNQKCMYGECTLCEDKQLPRIDQSMVNTEVTYHQWVTKQEERSKLTSHGEEKFQVKVTVKEPIRIRLSELYAKFEAELKPRVTTHIYNIRHQYTRLLELRKSLQADEAVIHIDFSENYVCKSNREIQSVHFGGSHNQVTLHTGIVYTSNGNIPFCSVSKSTRHDPCAIWAHMKPILGELRQFNKLSTVHFISDGPTTQYRNKKNFYFASVIPLEMGYKYATWNFLEAGHGKGAADGIGGALKRKADRLVSEGKDIPDAESLYQALIPNSTIKLYLVSEDEIRSVDNRVPSQLHPISETMKIHQV